MDYTDIKVKQAREMVDSFITVSRTLTKFSLQNATSLGLTLPQMGILNTISTFPEITLKEITVKLQLSKSTVSTTIDDLVNLKLIERKTNNQDRREINLTSTAKGKELSQQSCQNALSYRAMIYALDKIPEKEVRILTALHQKLLTHLQDFNC